MLKERDLYQSYKEESELMKKYIKRLENDQFKKVRGTSIPEITTTQARNRKLKELKTRAQKALHFCTLFGLELDHLRLKDPKTPHTYTVKLTTETPASPLKSANCTSLTNDSCPSSSPPTLPHGNLPISAAMTSKFFI